MKAMLHWQNGDHQEVELHVSNMRSDGHPKPDLHATNGERMARFWLDIEKYRAGRVVFDEVPTHG